MRNDTDPLNDPQYGLDAPTNVRRDDLLATQGLLRVLKNNLELPDGDDLISVRLVRRLSTSLQVSELPEHNFAPTEKTLTDDERRMKLVGMLDGLIVNYGRVINGS
jgi:hypothetical protein